MSDTYNLINDIRVTGVTSLGYCDNNKTSTPYNHMKGCKN